MWVGYDDFRPMPDITGGSLPTQAWHSYMSVAHKNYRAIPPIPGLGLHPNQVAEQQRLIDLRRTDPGMAQAQVAQAAQRSSSLMPDQTRTALKKVVESMRQASGLQPTPASTTPASASPPASVAPPGAATPKSRPPEPKAKPPVAATERRAEVPGATAPSRP